MDLNPTHLSCGRGWNRIRTTAALLTSPLLLSWCRLPISLAIVAGSKRQADARPDNERMAPLELWGYEPSPFVRPVREKLCALCLPHRLVPTSRGSANRDRLVAREGRQFQVPFLVDPNTGCELFESFEIIEYLDAVYTQK